MRIGVVVHESRRALFERASDGFNQVEFAWVIYRTEAEIEPRVSRMLADVTPDALWLGPVPYALVSTILPSGLPFALTHPGAFELLVTLSPIDIARLRGNPISIDTFDRSAVADVVDALGLNPAQVAVLPFRAGQTVEEIIQFHERLPNAIVVTARTAVVEALADRGGVFPVDTQVFTLRSQLRELVLRVAERRAQSSQFAAALVQPVGVPPETDNRIQELLTTQLAHMPEFAEAWIRPSGNAAVVILGYRATFERMTEGWTGLPAISALEAVTLSQLSIGIGVGTSPRNSTDLAEVASARATAAGSSCAYLLMFDGTAVGPIGDSIPLTFNYRDHSVELRTVSGLAGLSETSLSRLVAVEEQMGSDLIDATELASKLGVTVTSARRILRTLAAHDLVQSTGVVQKHGRGRPTRAYRLRLRSAIAAASRAEHGTARHGTDRNA